jgi:putative addiction module killer protein
MLSISAVYHYQTVDGRDLLQEWLADLRDHRARLAIQRRLARLLLGNLGDHKPCRDGVWEMRVDVGSGFRVYYTSCGQSVILLLCAGDKRTQDADISRAIECKKDFERRIKQDDNDVPPFH